jgi:hypothetical protein
MNSARQCFCDLAPLYVLDLLDEAERDWVEGQILENPELAEELLQYEVAATALPYGVQLAEVADDLEGRLFDALNLAPPEDTPVAEASNHNQLFTVRFQDIKWKAHPVPGVEVSIFYTDRMARRISGVLKASPGMQYPLHRHRGTEEIYMMSGDLRIGTQMYGAGDYIRSHPGSVHAPYSRDGCMFFFNTSMDDEYFETEPMPD